MRVPLNSTTIESLQPGDSGTFYTLANMAEFVRRDTADPAIRSYAEQLTSGVQPHDFGSEVAALFDYVQSIPYRRHPVDVQRVLDARAAIATGYLDCVSKSVLLATLLGSLGHLSRFAIIRQQCEDCEFDHVYLDALINGQWVPLDPTPDERSGGRQPMGWEATGVEKRVYPIWPGSVGGSLADECCSSCATGKRCEGSQGLGSPAVAAAAGGPIGMAIGGGLMIAQTIFQFWQAHQAKVAQEDQISGAWAAFGPEIIDRIKSDFSKGVISKDEAFKALDTLEHQFRVNVQPISKLHGHFGFLPNVDQPRPPDECNWGCGTSWDLHQEILGIKADMEAHDPGTESGVIDWQCLGYASKADWKADGKKRCPAVQTSYVVPATQTAGVSLDSITSSPLMLGLILLGVVLVAK